MTPTGSCVGTVGLQLLVPIQKAVETLQGGILVGASEALVECGWQGLGGGQGGLRFDNLTLPPVYSASGWQLQHDQPLEAPSQHAFLTKTDCVPLNYKPKQDVLPFRCFPISVQSQQQEH